MEGRASPRLRPAWSWDSRLFNLRTCLVISRTIILVWQMDGLKSSCFPFLMIGADGLTLREILLLHLPRHFFGRKAFWPEESTQASTKQFSKAKLTCRKASSPSALSNALWNLSRKTSVCCRAHSFIISLSNMKGSVVAGSHHLGIGCTTTSVLRSATKRGWESNSNSSIMSHHNKDLANCGLRRMKDLLALSLLIALGAACLLAASKAAASIQPCCFMTFHLGIWSMSTLKSPMTIAGPLYDMAWSKTSVQSEANKDHGSKKVDVCIGPYMEATNMLVPLPMSTKNSVTLEDCTAKSDSKAGYGFNRKWKWHMYLTPYHASYQHCWCASELAGSMHCKGLSS